MLVTTTAAVDLDGPPAWEKALTVLSLVPILACLYATIVLYKTVKQLKKIKELCQSLLTSTEAMATSAAKASLGPSTKKVLLEYAKTQQQLGKLLPQG